MPRKKGTQLFAEVTGQLKLSAKVEASALENAARTREAFAVALAPLSEGIPPPDIGPFQELMARWLAQSREKLIAIEERYADELRLDQRIRERRDEAARAVVGKLRVVKAHLDDKLGVDGTESIAGFGIGLHTFDPELLVRVSAQAAKALRRQNLAFVKAEKAAEVDFPALALLIEEPAAELRQILLEQQPSLRRSQAALAEKQQQLFQLTDDIRRVGAFLVGCYRLAKLDFQAERLRPARRSAAAEEEEPPPPVGSPPPGSPPPTGPPTVQEGGGPGNDAETN